MPSMDEVDTNEIKPWSDNLVHVEVVEEGRDYQISVFGSNIVELMEMDVAGKRLSDIKAKSVRLTRAEYTRVVRSGEPLFVVRGHSIREAGPSIRVARLALPFSSNGVDVDWLMVGVYPEQVSVAETVTGWSCAVTESTAPS